MATGDKGSQLSPPAPAGRVSPRRVRRLDQDEVQVLVQGYLAGSWYDPQLDAVFAVVKVLIHDQHRRVRLPSGALWTCSSRC